MRNFVLFYALALLSLHFSAHATPLGGTLINHLSSLLIRKLSNTKTSKSDGNVVQFENGYVVETRMK
ncbi:hypothetical protein MTR_8g058310 [Medicago truncatula]|uniref:Transmembrane protein n=1 Tax=Medicago truncatula TaxID=3880 RepID=G7LBX7_MEDTR|nr:hypothetical protein MTR_8g058310 [Medicago truncatula]